MAMSGTRAFSSASACCPAYHKLAVLEHGESAYFPRAGRRSFASATWIGLKSGDVNQIREEAKVSILNCKSRSVPSLEVASARSSAVDQTSSKTSTLEAPAPRIPLERISDVRIVSIAAGTSTLRGRSLERTKYEVEYGLKRGTTDNSYLIVGAEGNALIDVPDELFSQAWAEVLDKTFSIKSIKYLVLGHISPKRVEGLKALSKALSPQASPIQVYCSNPAAKLLKTSVPENVMGNPFIINSVRAGDTLDLGGGHVLRFILTPTPRWPDGMCTYDPATQLLFSQKLFCAHACDATDTDVGGLDDHGEDWRYYYDCMLAPVPRQAKAALDKLPIVAQLPMPSYSGVRGFDVVKADIKFLVSLIQKSLNVPVSTSAALQGLETGGYMLTAAICPLHGPIVRYSLTELVREYRMWTEEKLKQLDEATIAVMYASAYGNTAALAQAISRGISKAGIGIESINTETSTSEEVLAAIERCSGFVIGSPTLGGHVPTPVQNALGMLLSNSNATTKPCGVFGSFGWSGEAVDIIEQRLVDGGFSLAFPTIRCKFKPTEATLQTCEESGTDLAQVVRKAMQKQQRSRSSPQFTVASSVEQAVGRIVGALCVLSAKSGDAESAMLASWISQASFVPPGISVAVAKDRALEGLILPGGRFVVNVLGQNKAAVVSKQLLKPFKPGEPRFGELEVREASNGSMILKDAISWMECTVKSRLETGDHWVLYATVDSGELQDDKTLTAVHYRKTGARY